MQLKKDLTNHEEQLLYDPQTSGGLLLAVPGSQAVQLMEGLEAAGVETAVLVGEVVEGPYGLVVA